MMGDDIGAPGGDTFAGLRNEMLGGMDPENNFIRDAAGDAGELTARGLEAAVEAYFFDKISGTGKGPKPRKCKVPPPVKAAKGVGDAARFIVSAKGTAVEGAIADRWAKGTFGNVVDSMEYHFAKHGGGRTLQQYTDDAVRFFQQNKGQAQWGKWNPNWEPAYRLKVGNQGGYFTSEGRVLTYWD
jgi:hypothetical protein